MLELKEMCSRGTVSARDSFVYISEAVLSNHGAATETNRPENMQCLTVSIFKTYLLCVCVCVQQKYFVSLIECVHVCTYSKY